MARKATPRAPAPNEAQDKSAPTGSSIKPRVAEAVASMASTGAFGGGTGPRISERLEAAMAHAVLDAITTGKAKIDDPKDAPKLRDIQHRAREAEMAKINAELAAPVRSSAK